MKDLPDDMDASWSAWESHPDVRASALEWIQRASDTSFTPDEKLYTLIHEEPEKAFMTILALVQLIESDSVFFSFAAGPLEDFIAVNGPAYIDRIHKLALCHQRLRIALGPVNTNL